MRQVTLFFFGYADAADPQMGKISSLSTAAALVFFDIGGYTLPAENWKETLALIEAEQKVKDLATVIEQRLAVEITALQNGDQAIKDAITAAKAALIPSALVKKSAAYSGKAFAKSAASSIYSLSVSKSGITKSEATDPMAVTVISENPVSGIQIKPSDTSDGIVITNSYRRHCYYWVYYTGYKDDSGEDQILSSDKWLLKDSGYLKSTAALSGVIGTSLDYYITNKIPYIPVDAGPINLGAIPSYAKNAYYKVVVVGGTTWLNFLPPDWVNDNYNKNSYISSQILMGQITLVKDYLIPTIFAFVPVAKLNSFSGKQLGDFCAGLIGIVTKAGINSTLNAADQNYKAISWTITKAILTEGPLRNSICSFIATNLLGYVLTEKALADLSTSAKVLADSLKKCDIFLLGIDISSMSNDIAFSKGYEYFDVVGVKPDIHIEPATTTIKPGEEKKFTAIQGTVTGDVIEYRWSIKGTSGKIHKLNDTTSANDLTTSENTVVYQANITAQDKEIEILNVEVWRKQITDTGVVLQKIGTSSSTINISNSPSDAIQLKHKVPVLGGNALVDLAYFIIPKINGSTSYWVDFNDNGYPYDPGTEGFGGRVFSTPLIFRINQTTHFGGSGTMEAYLLDRQSDTEDQHWTWLFDAINLNSDDMVILLERQHASERYDYYGNHYTPEEVYAQDGLQLKWEIFEAKAQKWTISYKKW